MDNFYARAVFFVRDAPSSLDFYTKTLGFKPDWTYEEGGKAFVFQVSLHGFELILNQAEGRTEARPGHGRVFIGLSENQLEPFRKHIEDHTIETEDFHWGAPTIVIHDLDRNELFFWLPRPESE